MACLLSATSFHPFQNLIIIQCKVGVNVVQTNVWKKKLHSSLLVSCLHKIITFFLYKEFRGSVRNTDEIPKKKKQSRWEHCDVSKNLFRGILHIFFKRKWCKLKNQGTDLAYLWKASGCLRIWTRLQNAEADLLKSVPRRSSVLWHFRSFFQVVCVQPGREIFIRPGCRLRAHSHLLLDVTDAHLH